MVHCECQWAQLMNVFVAKDGDDKLLFLLGTKVSTICLFTQFFFVLAHTVLG